MNVDNDRYLDFSLAQKDTLMLQSVAIPSQSEPPSVARTPKKMRLERMPFSGTTSAIIRAIRKIRVKCLPEYFEQTCDRRPDDIAVICGSSQLTYQELDSQANRLAHFLILSGVEKGDVFGILLEHSLQTYIVLLGILKAGAAFVPLDPTFPANRVAFIATDAGLSGLITTSTYHEKTKMLSCPALEIDQADETLSMMPESRPQISIDPASLCYINYTPDTTDKPKGVIVSHANIVSFLEGVTPIYGITHNDRVYQGMSISLDTSLEEIWPTWIAGATLIVSLPTSQYDGNELVSAPQVAIRAVSGQEAKVSKPGMLKQLSVKSIYKNIMTDPLYRNSLFNMASTFMLGGLGFIFWIIIARLYKPENVGIATTLISIMTLLSGLTIMGFNVSLNRYLPKSTQKNDLINSSFVIATFAAILASVVFLASLKIFSPQLLFLQSNIFYSISFTIFIIFCSWNTLVESVSMAFRAASNILVKNAIVSILKLLLPFAFIAFGAYGIFASTALALSLGVLFSLIILMIKFKIKPSISVNISLIKETGAYSFANYITDFTFYMPSLLLPIVILNTLSAKYAAYYYVASMIQSILLIIPLAASQALLTEGSYNEYELRKHVKKAFATILYILIPATAIIVLGGNILLQAFGKSYASEAFQFLRLYSISTIFSSLILISNAIMNVKHQIKSLVFLNVLASIITLWFSYAFISGRLIGIGWGWILGQGIAGVISLVFIIHNIHSKK